MNTHVTTLPRAMLGLFAGTLAGALLVTLYVAVMSLKYLLDNGMRDMHVGTELFIIFAYFVYSAVVWAAGLILVATLPWAVLHYCQLRSWSVAVALGTTLTFMTALGWMTLGFGLLTGDAGFSGYESGAATWIDGRLTLHGWIVAAKPALTMSIAGAMVGFVVWRTAYRRVPESRALALSESNGNHRD
jgi:hypothetical protein